MTRYLRAANVKDGTLDLTSVLSMNFSPKEQEIFSLRPGDVLVTEGSGSLKSVGAASVWQGELEGTVCFQNTLLRLRPRPGTDPDFLGWWARAAYASELFASIATGANIYHISAERVRALPVTLPSLEEQRRIADFLNVETRRIDDLLILDRAALSRIRERDRAHRDLLIDEISSESGNAPLRRFMQGIEQGSSPQCDNSARTDPEEWAVLKLSSIKRGNFEPSENKRLPNEIHPSRRHEVRQGDLLVTRANTPELVGDTATVKQQVRKLLLPDLIYRVKLHPEVDPEFVSQVILGSRVRSLIQATARGSSQSMVKLRGEDIKDWPIPCASSGQQKDFVKIIQSWTESSAELKKQIDRRGQLLMERRQALITAAVTGQIDVKTARGI